jgi:uncharacterized tellurite resistance protein B-like protein
VELQAFNALVPLLKNLIRHGTVFIVFFQTNIVMENNIHLLEDNTAEEKEAYLGAIASIATADREGTEEEINFLTQLSVAAQLSEDQIASVLNVARDPSGTELPRYLQILKNSDLKFSFVTDLISFAKSDGNYSEAEEGKIQQMADYLGVNQNQVSVLDQVVEKTSNGEVTPEQAANPNFLSSLGLGDKLSGAGINGGSLLKNLIAIAAPMIIGGMVSRGMNRSSSSGRGGGLLGGLLGGGGGMLGGGGGLGGMLGGNRGGGGLGSLIGMLSGGRGMGSTGGLLGKILGSKF